MRITYRAPPKRGPLSLGPPPKSYAMKHTSSSPKFLNPKSSHRKDIQGKAPISKASNIALRMLGCLIYDPRAILHWRPPKKAITLTRPHIFSEMDSNMNPCSMVPIIIRVPVSYRFPPVLGTFGVDKEAVGVPVPDPRGQG